MDCRDAIREPSVMLPRVGKWRLCLMSKEFFRPSPMQIGADVVILKTWVQVQSQAADSVVKRNCRVVVRSGKLYITASTSASALLWWSHPPGTSRKPTGIMETTHLINYFCTLQALNTFLAVSLSVGGCSSSRLKINSVCDP